MPNNIFSVTLRSLSYELPQGKILFQNLSTTFTAKKQALVGPNGVGKSTLAKLLIGELTASSGEIETSHKISYLAQYAEPPPQTVAEYLLPVWEDLRLDPALLSLLIEGIAVEQNLSQLSGGQWMRLRLALAMNANEGMLILDEPTNNLDSKTRERIRSFVRSYDQALLVISHDRDLLQEMDVIIELSNQGLSTYGGNFDFYQDEKDKEEARAEQELQTLRREKKKAERAYHEKIASQEKRIRAGKRLEERGGLPRILVGALKRQAQTTLANVHVKAEGALEEKQERLREKWESTKQRSTLLLSLPETSLAEGKQVFKIEDFNFRYSDAEQQLWPNENLDLVMKGPRRWALAGSNGSGKSTLIDVLTRQGRSQRGVITGDATLADIPWAYLDQSYALLKPDQSVLENVMDSSQRDLKDVRNQLALFQFFGEMVNQKITSLSQGEKLKCALAKILLASPAPQFLILDEPTNNLDLQSLTILEQALCDYEGALLVVSHDEVFLNNIQIEQLIQLD